MSVEIVIAVLSALLTIASLTGSFAQIAAARRQEQLAEALKVRPQPDFSVATDPRSAGDELFKALGPLSLEEYAADADVRRYVERTVGRLDAYLNESRAPAAATERWHPQFTEARIAIEREDPVGALARIRLAIELSLRDLAAAYGLSSERYRGPTGELKGLVRADAVSPSQAQDLTTAVRIANAALHGERTSVSHAEEAYELAVRSLPRG